MPSKIRWRPNEPAREEIYRKLYDRIANQDGCITFLLVELRAVQRRLDQLEKWRARTATGSALSPQPNDVAAGTFEQEVSP